MGRIRARIPVRDQLNCHIGEVEPACLAPAVDYLLKLGRRSPQRRFLIEKRLTLAAVWYRFGCACEARLPEQAQLKEEVLRVVKAAGELAQAMNALPDTYLESEFLAVSKIGARAQSLIAKMASPGVGSPRDYATKALIRALAPVYILETGKQPKVSKNSNSADKRSRFHELACIVRKAIDPDRGAISATTCQVHLKEWRASMN